MNITIELTKNDEVNMSSKKIDKIIKKLFKIKGVAKVEFKKVLAVPSVNWQKAASSQEKLAEEKVAMTPRSKQLLGEIVELLGDNVHIYRIDKRPHYDPKDHKSK